MHTYLCSGHTIVIFITISHTTSRYKGLDVRVATRRVSKSSCIMRHRVLNLGPAGRVRFVRLSWRELAVPVKPRRYGPSPQAGRIAHLDARADCVPFATSTSFYFRAPPFATSTPFRGVKRRTGTWTAPRTKRGAISARSGEACRRGRILAYWQRYRLDGRPLASERRAHTPRPLSNTRGTGAGSTKRYEFGKCLEIYARPAARTCLMRARTAGLPPDVIGSACAERAHSALGLAACAYSRATIDGHCMPAILGRSALGQWARARQGDRCSAGEWGRRYR
jgi:hypothetical protein